MPSNGVIYVSGMRVLECQPFFYNLEKQNFNFDFQFSISKKTNIRIKHQISIFNLQEKQKLKFVTYFHISIFRVFLTSGTSKSEKAWNEQRPEDNENQSQGIQRKMFVHFCCSAWSIALVKHG